MLDETDSVYQTDVIIIGGGIAGISLALHLPLERRVTLLTKQALGESNTRYAQGGLAACIGPDDTPASQFIDTLAAGAGHSDAEAVRVLTDEARHAVEELLAVGTQFDPATASATATVTIGDVTLALGHEAAHSHHRVLHAAGDATGAEIERALVETLRNRPNVTVIEQGFVTDIVMRDEIAAGITYIQSDGQTRTLHANAVVLANGGAGRLWVRTSNPPGATADGLALAWRAGATLTDLEFVQFHPTVLVPPDASGPTFLISEAVRGEGAYLLNNQGERFMLAYDGAELAPRDVVARGITEEMLREQSDHVWLDLRHLEANTVLHRFPNIAATCAQYGIDITTDLIPVAPAAHYYMGGVAVDLEARTTVPHLWAVGEVACTGVHGANRLASNSLLEGVVYGIRAAASVAEALTQIDSTVSWPRQPRFAGETLEGSPLTLKRTISPSVYPLLQRIMWERVGLYRDDAGLTRATEQVQELAEEWPTYLQLATVTDIVHAHETANMVLVAQLIIAAAHARRESRGAHARRDYPATNELLAQWRYFASQGTYVSSSAVNIEPMVTATDWANQLASMQLDEVAYEDGVSR